jgi:hypothetical protein
VRSETNRNAYAWEALYEQAITEVDTDLRDRRLAEAEKAILERAKFLDDQPGAHDLEALALEEAASFIREKKRETETDGVCKQVSIGDKEQWPKGKRNATEASD